MSPPEPYLRPDVLGPLTALISGGSGEVGVAVGRQLVANGARTVGLLGRDDERGAQAVAAIEEIAPDATVRFLRTDANDPGQVGATVADFVAEFGRIDALVNSLSGSFDPQICHEIPLADIGQIVHEQMTGTLLMCRAVLPTMRAQRHGSIVNIASDAAKHATPGEAVIGAAMAGIVMFTRGLAMESKREQIRVNAVTPSFLAETRRYESIRSSEFGAKLVEKIEQRASLGLATPDDVAQLVVWLCSPLAGRVTGQVISPNGGISA